MYLCQFDCHYWHQSHSKAKLWFRQVVLDFTLAILGLIYVKHRKNDFC